jgi:hypothetical protein
MGVLQLDGGTDLVLWSDPTSNGCLAMRWRHSGPRFARRSDPEASSISSAREPVRWLPFVSVRESPVRSHLDSGTRRVGIKAGQEPSCVEEAR